MTKALILPPLRRTAADAARFATVVHEGQIDKAGKPYVEHLARVAAGVLRLSGGCPFWSDQERDEAVQIAWLHDTIEDEKVTREDLVGEGFVRAVGLAVRDLDGKGGWTYSEFIAWICEKCDLPTILVKLADVEDNSDPERLALLPEETRERLLRKYEPAKEVLRAAARQKGWMG
ncbi:metal-dependent phosphohydrolase [Methylobacterium fujisawaense]|uniref:metal-dependent phosphohydrolase n=1 Tax=Methylobacterium fujisawaense TaxID=107400 RepID=UPI00313B0B97